MWCDKFGLFLAKIWLGKITSRDRCFLLIFVAFGAQIWKIFNSAQNRGIVKGEAQKFPLFWRLSGGSGAPVFSRNFTREPLNLIEAPIFGNTPSLYIYLSLQ